MKSGAFDFLVAIGGAGAAFGGALNTEGPPMGVAGTFIIFVYSLGPEGNVG